MFDYELYLVTKLDVYSLTYEWAQNVKLTWIQKNRKTRLVELQNLVELKKTYIYLNRSWKPYK
jgi:hypothetical protein